MKKTYEEVERRRKSWFLWIGEYPSIFDFYYTLLHVSGAFMEIYRAFALRNNLQRSKQCGRLERTLPTRTR